MGTTGFSSAFSSVFSFSMHPILGAVLAGLGFWPKAVPDTHAPAKAKIPTQTAHVPDSLEQPVAPEKQAAQRKTLAVNTKQSTQTAVHPMSQPLRVVRFVEAGVPAANASQMAGRMVISGRMSDVCAELDRLAA